MRVPWWDYYMWVVAVFVERIHVVGYLQITGVDGVRGSYSGALNNARFDEQKYSCLFLELSAVLPIFRKVQEPIVSKVLHRQFCIFLQECKLPNRIKRLERIQDQVVCIGTPEVGTWAADEVDLSVHKWLIRLAWRCTDLWTGTCKLTDIGLSGDWYRSVSYSASADPHHWGALYKCPLLLLLLFSILFPFQGFSDNDTSIREKCVDDWTYLKKTLRSFSNCFLNYIWLNFMIWLNSYFFWIPLNCI